MPETGSTCGDLDELMRGAVRLYTGPLAPRLMPDLISEMARNTALAEAVRRGFLARRRDALRTVLARGVERGDLRSDLDYELTLDILLAPLFYRLLVTGERIDRRLVDSVVALTMRAFAPQKPSHSNPTDRKELP